MLKFQGSLVVYHVTPEENVLSILRDGLLPEKATSKWKVVWLVSRMNISWAMIHCSNAHRVFIDEMAVCAVHVTSEQLYHFNRPGRYYSSQVLNVESATPAMFFYHDQPDVTPYFDREQFDIERALYRQLSNTGESDK